MSDNQIQNDRLGPYVRIVGEGIDILIHVDEEHDAHIAHQAIDLAFGRHKSALDIELAMLQENGLKG